MKETFKSGDTVKFNNNKYIFIVKTNNFQHLINAKMIKERNVFLTENYNILVLTKDVLTEKQKFVRNGTNLKEIYSIDLYSRAEI